MCIHTHTVYMYTHTHTHLHIHAHTYTPSHTYRVGEEEFRNVILNQLRLYVFRRLHRTALTNDRKEESMLLALQAQILKSARYTAVASQMY